MNGRLKTINDALNKVLEVAKNVAELNSTAGTVVSIIDKLRKVSSVRTMFLIILTGS